MRALAPRFLAALCLVAALPLACIKYPWLPATVMETVASYHEPYPDGTASYLADRKRLFLEWHLATGLYVLGTASLVGLCAIATRRISRRLQVVFWVLAGATGLAVAGFERSKIGSDMKSAYAIMTMWLPLAITGFSLVGFTLTMRLRSSEKSPTPATGMGASILGALLLVSATAALAQSNAPASGGCGEVVTIKTHGGTTTRYALAYPPAAPAPGGRVALVLLVGGGGHVALDDRGCPRALVGNSLVRSLPHFHGAGFATALVDAPSDHVGDDGLAGFRTAAEHADDLGKVIADVRARTNTSVWLVGTSRGAISAVNAAARLSGASAPDGLVLTSALMSGFRGGQKSWLVQTVFDLPLEAIRSPLLVVGHAEDKCIRSPAGLMANIAARANGAREQVVTVAGGPGRPGSPSVEACEGRAPHGFVEQEAEVAAGIGRFIDGGKY